MKAAREFEKTTVAVRHNSTRYNVGAYINNSTKHERTALPHFMSSIISQIVSLTTARPQNDIN